MSVDIYGYKKKEYIKKGEEDLYYPVASLSDYLKYWLVGITENNIKIFRDSSVFSADQLQTAIEELKILLNWCDKNITDGYQKIMHKKIEEILVILSRETKDSFEEFSVG